MNNWKVVFYITAVIYVAGGLLFLLFGSAEPQDWAMVHTDPAKDLEPPSSFNISGFSVTNTLSIPMTVMRLDSSGQ